MGQDLQFDCYIGIFHGTTIHCLLVVMATVEVAPYVTLIV
jgi:hypothetical protein